MGRLKWCPKCKENSTTVVGAKPRKYDGKIKRTEICLNKGCGYTLDLDPDVPAVAKLKAETSKNQGQLVFDF